MPSTVVIVQQLIIPPKVNQLFDALALTDLSRQTKSQETSTMTTTNSGTITTPLTGSGQNHVGSQISQDDAPMHKMEETSKSEGTQAGGTLQHGSMTSKTSTGTGTRTKDYNDEMVGVKSTNHDSFLLLEEEEEEENESSEQLKYFVLFCEMLIFFLLSFAPVL